MPWTQGMEDEAKARFEEALRIQVMGPVFERLREIIKDQTDSINRRQGSETLFDNPSWSHLQAHMMGRKQGLQAILELISPKER